MASGRMQIIFLFITLYKKKSKFRLDQNSARAVRITDIILDICLEITIKPIYYYRYILIVIHNLTICKHVDKSEI